MNLIAEIEASTTPFTTQSQSQSEGLTRASPTLWASRGDDAMRRVGEGQPWHLHR